MLETYDELLERARAMAQSGPHADLAPYDRAALQAVLDRLERLEQELGESDER
jgi:hypothetical protein